MEVGLPKVQLQSRDLVDVFRNVVLYAMLLFALSATAAALFDFRVQAGQVEPRYVFAHYMACCARGGHKSTVEQYQTEIREAISSGIDGFAVDVGAWNREPAYQVITERLFDAADTFENFKLFFSFDNLSSEETIDALRRFARRKSYLRVDGQPVVSTFGEDAAWAKLVKAALTASGTPIKLMPYMYYPINQTAWNRVPRARSNFDSDVTATVLNDLPDLYGYFYFGAGYPYQDIVSSIHNIAGLLHAEHKLVMVGIAPYYKGFGNNSRVFESDGFAGMRAQWLAAIESQADWVELVTWNDWGESTYLESFGAPKETELWDFAWGPLLDHSAFLSASRYYIEWFKSRRMPEVVSQQLFYFYRIHPKTAIGFTDPVKKVWGRPGNWEKLHDGIYFAYYLKSPAKVIVVGDHASHEVDLDAGAGISNVPLAMGTIKICIYQNGRVTGQKTLEQAITQAGEIGNFNYFSGKIDILKRDAAAGGGNGDASRSTVCVE